MEASESGLYFESVKKIRFHPISFRPICLASFVLTTVEKVTETILELMLLCIIPNIRVDMLIGQDVLRDIIETKEIAICAFLHIEGGSKTHRTQWYEAP